MDQKEKGNNSRRVIREVVYLRHLTSDGISTMLAMYPRIESRSRLMETAINWYLDCVKRYGLNADWHPPIPGVTTDVAPGPSSVNQKITQHTPSKRNKL